SRDDCEGVHALPAKQEAQQPVEWRVACLKRTTRPAQGPYCNALARSTREKYNESAGSPTRLSTRRYFARNRHAAAYCTRDQMAAHGAPVCTESHQPVAAGR